MSETVAALDPCQWNGTALVFKIWVYVLPQAVDEAIRNGPSFLFGQPRFRPIYDASSTEVLLDD